MNRLLRRGARSEGRTYQQVPSTSDQGPPIPQTSGQGQPIPSTSGQAPPIPPTSSHEDPPSTSGQAQPIPSTSGHDDPIPSTSGTHDDDIPSTLDLRAQLPEIWHPHLPHERERKGIPLFEKPTIILSTPEVDFVVLLTPVLRSSYFHFSSSLFTIKLHIKKPGKLPTLGDSFEMLRTVFRRIISRIQQYYRENKDEFNYQIYPSVLFSKGSTYTSGFFPVS